MISKRRGPVAREIYEQIGGSSPLLPNTKAQADALAKAVGGDAEVFVAMRYWHPRSDETAAAVKAYEPNEVLLIPLYPQYSGTTTGSSIADWRRAATSVGLTAPTRSLCCYPTEDGFVRAVADGIRPLYEKAQASGTPRILFSAHGLPKKVIARGDPYQYQVERTAGAVVLALGGTEPDHIVCYQSRVGPLEWIGPATDAEIERAGADGVPIVVVPIAFVSEHSETLVELDIEYRALAERAGVPLYLRAPTVDVGKKFIGGLVRQIEMLRRSDKPICGQDGVRVCPAEKDGAFSQCALATADGGYRA